MEDRAITRRQFARAATTVSLVGFAGCSEDLSGFDPRNIPGGGADTPGGPSDEPEEPEQTDDVSDENDDPSEEGDETPEWDDASSVRVVHASPDGPSVDVYIDGERTLENVSFRTVSEPLLYPAGTHEIEMTAAGDPQTAVFNEELSVQAGTETTLAAIGETAADTFEVRTYVDDVSSVPAGESRVQILHFSPDAPDIDVVVSDSDELLFVDLTFGDPSESATVPAGAYTLDVRPAGESDTLASFDVEFEAETAHTVFAMGYLVPDDAVADEPFDLAVAAGVYPE